MQKKRIMWIDDEIEEPLLRPYVDEFEENGFEVIKVKSTFGLINSLKVENSSTLAAILVDVIMPAGCFAIDKTKAGIYTGLVVMEMIMSYTNLKDIPIICVSHFSNEEVLAFCIEHDIPFVSKMDYFSNEFVKEISKLIRK